MDDFRLLSTVHGVNQRFLRLTIDLFVADDLPIRVIEGWQILDPKYLLGLYRNIHSSDKCFAVQAAVKLIEQGLDPVGRRELLMPQPGDKSG